MQTCWHSSMVIHTTTRNTGTHSISEIKWNFTIDFVCNSNDNYYNLHSALRYFYFYFFNLTSASQIHYCIATTYLTITVLYFCSLNTPWRWPKKPIYVGGFPHVCVSLYLIIVQLLEYIWWLWVKLLGPNHQNTVLHASAVEHDLYAGNITCWKHKDTGSGLLTNLLQQHHERHLSLEKLVLILFHVWC